MGFLTNLFKKKNNIALNKRTPLIKRPPVLVQKNKKIRIKNNSHLYDDREVLVEYEDDGYDYALDVNGVYDFDRDGGGVGEENDDIAAPCDCGCDCDDDCDCDCNCDDDDDDDDDDD